MEEERKENLIDELEKAKKEALERLVINKREIDELGSENHSLKETLQSKREIISILKGLLEVALGKDR